MATVQTIATTLTADPRPFTRGINVAKASTEDFGRAFQRLDATTRRANIGGGLTSDLRSVGGASSNAARGVLELSRGVEDAAVSFGLNGVQGAIRGSLNNISQFAMMMGGPVAGAIAGFTAAGVSIAAPYVASLLEAGDAAKRLAQETDNAIKNGKTLLDLRTKEAEGRIDFRRELGGMDDPNEARSGITNREAELEKIAARQKEIEEARIRNRFERPENGDFEGRFGVENAEAMRQRADAADQRDSELMRERLELLRKETEIRVEIGRMRMRELELTKEQQEVQRQKDQEEFSNIIRKFQEEDEQEEERKREEEERQQRRKQERDQDRLEGLLKSRFQGLGGKVDPLEGMEGIPEELKDQIRGLLGEADELNKRPRAQFAQVATAGSQSLLRAQYQAKEAAERKKEQMELRKKFDELIKEVKGLRNDQQIEAEESVNI